MQLEMTTLQEERDEAVSARMTIQMSLEKQTKENRQKDLMIKSLQSLVKSKESLIEKLAEDCQV